jgi:hypothetical protein
MTTDHQPSPAKKEPLQPCLPELTLNLEVVHQILDGYI